MVDITQIKKKNKDNKKRFTYSDLVSAASDKHFSRFQVLEIFSQKREWFL